MFTDPTTRLNSCIVPLQLLPVRAPAKPTPEKFDDSSSGDHDRITTRRTAANYAGGYLSGGRSGENEERMDISRLIRRVFK